MVNTEVANIQLNLTALENKLQFLQIFLPITVSYRFPASVNREINLVKL